MFPKMHDCLSSRAVYVVVQECISRLPLPKCTVCTVPATGSLLLYSDLCVMAL